MFLVITGYFALHTLVRVLLAHGCHVPHLQVARGQHREVLWWLPSITPHPGLGSWRLHPELVSSATPEVIFVWYKVSSTHHLHLAAAVSKLWYNSMMNNVYEVVKHSTLNKTVHLWVNLLVMNTFLLLAATCTVLVVNLPHTGRLQWKSLNLLLWTYLTWQSVQGR